MPLIVLPFPNMTALHSQNKGRWETKHPARKKAREDGFLAAFGKEKIAGKATIEYRFFPKDDRARDEANMIQAMKPYIDGIKDAGLIEEDRWQMLHIVAISVEIDRKNPRVELVIT